MSHYIENHLRIWGKDAEALEELGVAISHSEIIHHYYRFDDDWD